MVAIGHTAVGIIAGTITYQLWGENNLVSGLVISGSVGIISHYIGDFIPHGHYVKSLNKSSLLAIIVFDVLLPIILLLGVFYLKNGFHEKLLYLMVCIGGAQLPDVLDGLVYTKIMKATSLLKLENDFHQGIHWHGKGVKTLLMGLRDIWQLLIVFTAIFLILI